MMAAPVLRMGARMSDSEALMWKAERDPVLRSSFLSITVCDGPLDVGRFRRRMALVVEAVPRLRQRVREHPVGPPTWVEDTAFELEHHVRHTALAAPGSDRQLLDLAADLFEDTFDPARPLWTFVAVDGLAGGRGALISKLHHTITDGVGGIRMSGMFIDLAPDQEQPTLPPAEERPDPGLAGWIGGLVAPVVAQARSTMEVAGAAVADPPATATGGANARTRTHPRRGASLGSADGDGAWRHVPRFARTSDSAPSSCSSLPSLTTAKVARRAFSSCGS